MRIVSKFWKIPLISFCFVTTFLFWIKKLNQPLDNAGRGIDFSNHITIDLILAVAFGILLILNTVIVWATNDKITLTALIIWVVLSIWLLCYLINYKSWFPF
ncbi:MAG: hypothetical protein IPI65_22190 [Bacteroidetes bacterium]|nr:hypothetical protein [Bacteroidota bacterium]